MFDISSINIKCGLEVCALFEESPAALVMSLLATSLGCQPWYGCESATALADEDVPPVGCAYVFDQHCLSSLLEGTSLECHIDIVAIHVICHAFNNQLTKSVGPHPQLQCSQVLLCRDVVRKDFLQGTQMERRHYRPPKPQKIQ